MRILIHKCLVNLIIIIAKMSYSLMDNSWNASDILEFYCQNI